MSRVAAQFHSARPQAAADVSHLYRGASLGEASCLTDARAKPKKMTPRRSTTPSS